MELTFECPRCHTVGRTPIPESTGEATCRSCGETHSLKSGAVDPDGLRSCPWCATTDLYIQKDFPQGLGLAIVIVGFVISTVYWYYEKPIPAFAVLLASALLDMVLYSRVPDVTICYRCLSQVRGVGSNPGGKFLPFDLAIGERYRQERIRVERLREERARSANPSSPLRD